jgi:hypothetical protein
MKEIIMPNGLSIVRVIYTFAFNSSSQQSINQQLIERSVDHFLFRICTTPGGIFDLADAPG